MKGKLLLIVCVFFSCRIFSVGIEGVSPVNNYNSPTFVVNFCWNPVSSQTTYRLKIAQDLAFTNILNDITLNQTAQQVIFNNSTSGVYWKVSTSGNNGYMESEIYKLNFINPVQDSNVLLWLSADSNVVLNPDSTISAWNNIVPNGLNAVQGNVNAQPRLVNNINLLNSTRSIRFDGSSDFLQVNSGGLFGSAYIVCNWRGGAVFPTFNGILTKQSISVFDDYLIMANSGSTNLFNNSYFRNKTRINNNDNNLLLSFSPLINYKVVSGRRDGTILNISNFNIGREPDFNGLWNGDMSEIIISKNSSIGESDSIHTYLYNKYTPPVTMRDTVIGTNFCSPVTISAPYNYISYLWSSGSTVSTVNITPNATYSLTTKDIFNRESSTSFNVYPYLRLGNKTAFICIGDTFKVDLKTPAGFTALWNTGATTTKLNISTGGQYTVKITDNGGCFVYDTINIIVDNPQLAPTPNVSGNLSLCNNEKLFLQTITAFDSIRWSTGSTDNFIAVTAPGPYTVYGRTTTGCVINKSFNVTITGNAPTANFVVPKVCQNTAVVFNDSSTITGSAVITDWKWTFGDNNAATVKNPTNTYTNLGSYTVGLRVTTNLGCTDSIGKTIVVNRKPSPSFYNLLSCAGVATTFVDQSVANAAAITNWNWDFAGLGTVNGIQNPLFEFPSSGVYGVKLTATNSNSCSDTVTILTRVNASPVSNFSFDSVCGKTAVTLKFLATVESPSVIPDINWGSWDFGDGSIETAIRNPQHVYDTPGSYDVSLIVRSSDQCIDTVVKRIKVFDFPLVDFTVSQTQCAGKEIQFTDISVTSDGTPLTKWNWFFSGQATSEEQNPRYAFNAQGNYTVQLTARNAVGCTGTKLRSVAISAPPTPAFTFSPQNGLPPLTVNYFNQSPVNGNYLWDYGDGSPLVEGYNPPVHIYTEKGTYPIKLIATDFRGCTDTLTKLILVDKAFLDGVMASVSIIPNGEFYKIQVSVINNSNVEITALGLSLQLGGGAVIRENWTGSLLPGQTTVYLFTGEIKIGDNGQIPVICASIDNINNNAAEDRTDNNTSCKEVAVGSFDVLSVYPNPAYEVINFGVMLPKEGRVNIRFIDILGQQMYSKDFDGLKGYNSLSISTMQLNAAVYVAEVSYDGQVVRKKFMRKDRK
jgi:PKD repeat protein